MIEQLGPHWPAGGAPPGFEVVTYALASVDPDQEVARRKIRASTADDWRDWLSVVGDPPEAAQAIGKLFDAGSTSVVLCVAAVAVEIDYIGREVLPRI